MIWENENFHNDFIKFTIRDAVNGKWIIFPAFLKDNIKFRIQNNMKK